METVLVPINDKKAYKLLEDLEGMKPYKGAQKKYTAATRSF